MQEIKGGSKESMEFLSDINGLLLLVPFICMLLHAGSMTPVNSISLALSSFFPFILFVLYFHFDFHFAIPSLGSVFHFLGFLLFVPVILLLFLFRGHILELLLRAPWLLNIIIYCVFRFLNLFKSDCHDEVYLSIVVAYISLQYMNHWHVKKKVRRIKRECKILGAVCEDISNFKARDCPCVDERYRQFFNSHRDELTDKEEEWVNRTKEVVKNAGPLFLEEEPGSVIKAFFAGAQQWLNRQLLLPQFMEVRSIWENLSQQRRGSDFVRDIYKELEKSRAKSRSLESMLIKDEKKQVLARMPSAIEKAAKHIPGYLKRKYQVKYELFKAFLMDLEHAKSELAIEKAWLEEMRAFLDDVEEALNTFTRRKERKGLYKLFNNIFSMADNLLQIHLQWMDDELFELLEMKSRYDFKLIVIQHQTDPYQKHVRDNHDHILSVVGNIPETDHKIRPLCVKLKEMHGSLKAKEGANNFRIKCSEQMKTAADELKEIWKHRLTKKVWDRVSGETGSIDSQTNDMEKFTAACDLVRQKSPIIGLEEDTGKLVSKLTSESEKCCVFFVVGMQGIGKTTLAEKIYHDKEIFKHFDRRLWVSVTNNGNNAVLYVGNKITRNDERQKPEEVKGMQVYIPKIQDFLHEKKCLVVLDDVSTEDVCNKLKNAFSESGNGSKFLLTTRDMTVGSDTERHHLRLRTKEESWELFRHKVQFTPELVSIDEILKEAEKAVGRCSGLPLTLSRLGVLLAGEIIDAQLLREASERAHQPQETSQLWSKNLEILRLNDDLKRRFSCCTPFPKNYAIPPRRLIAIWVAEGLVQEKPGGANAKTLERIARDCLSELINFNIIQPLKKNINGTVKTCCVPDPLHDRLRPGNPQQSLRCVLSASSDGQQLDETYHNNDVIVDSYRDIHRPNVGPKSSESLVSLISFDSREGDKPGNDIGHFLHRGIAEGRFRKLKVLDLERVFRPQLPKTIGKLVELRYLGLRWTYLEEIPSTIGNLSNLQTLDLKHTYIRILPSTIGKLQKLRRLYLNQTCRGKFVQQSKTKSLLSLETLWGVFLDENSPLKDRIDELKSLRKLELSFHLSSGQQEELAKKIARLTNLRSLRLRSVSVMSEPEGLHLGNFKQLDNLFSMYLFGRLGKASYFSKFPEGLSDLTLSASGLEDDPMPVLEKFCNLKSLCLYADSFKGKRMACSTGGFSELLVLKIWKLNNLEVWTIQDQAMLKLNELEIRCCPKLEVPDGLMHLQTLREVKLGGMQNEFTDGLVEYTKLRQDPPSIINLES